ncbi:hypothetical protein, partial [Embleya hyalina]|uniref:hypothetical protein n=1 Tax=Embleya hyalina TaxID=516124 RepID=UPI001C3FCF4A
VRSCLLSAFGTFVPSASGSWSLADSVTRFRRYSGADWEFRNPHAQEQQIAELVANERDR